MAKAQVKLSWGASVSPDVVDYKVLVNDETNSVVLVDQIVTSAVTELTFEADEKTVVSASVVASDGVNLSDPATTSLDIGDLESPQAPTFAAMEIVGIVPDAPEVPAE